ncbi:MAG: leucyl/phenylalanyl-tRNA--protein transferase [Armatimonadetes bacterium]|nr:leucyl/phenylalanyl-tRNA--protein transferase [Armatimonadota bacterium]MBS1710217.1 leucyl/phenylalanyl-tRNA--protein transferase [Armatimonadota bacterium]MBX3110107.1 leucyl/phenylalanyl-tRNA--protein transferase [Fimbriimonadaceae bacterium]
MPDGQLTTDMLWAAYQEGAFPMADDSGDVQFYLTRGRAVFPGCSMRVNRSLAKQIRKGGYQVTFDTAFDEVVAACFRPRDNWLTPELARVYGEAHREGWAHSCEVWVGGELAGGIFGEAVGGWFSADSMFTRHTDMGKIALFELLKKLRDLGFVCLDSQIMNSHTARLGCVQLTEQEFHQIFTESIAVETAWGRRQAASSST